MNVSDAFIQINAGISSTGNHNEDDFQMTKVIPTRNSDVSLHKFFLDRRECKATKPSSPNHASDDLTELTSSETDYSESLNASSWHSHGSRGAAEAKPAVAEDALPESVEDVDVTSL